MKSTGIIQSHRSTFVGFALTLRPICGPHGKTVPAAGIRASNALPPATGSSTKKQGSSFRARSTSALDKPAETEASIMPKMHETSGVKALALQTKDALEKVWDTEVSHLHACLTCLL